MWRERRARLRARLAQQQELGDCCAIIFAETWLHRGTLDWDVARCDRAQDYREMRYYYNSDAWCLNVVKVNRQYFPDVDF